METERVRLRDPTPETIGRQARRIDGGILNLDAAFIAALREAQMDEVRTLESGLSAAPASPSGADSGEGEENEGEEKSRLKAPSYDPQDWLPDSFQPLPDHALDQDLGESQRRTSFDWNGAFRQSMFFLSIEHAFRLGTESTQFELGLFSEAALGNIGIRPYGKAKHPMAYVDLVVTPVLGTGWLVGEDLLDRYLIRRLENKISSRVVRLIIRTFLNPTRSFANLLRVQRPWHRDNRQ